VVVSRAGRHKTLLEHNCSNLSSRPTWDDLSDFWTCEMRVTVHTAGTVLLAKEFGAWYTPRTDIDSRVGLLYTGLTPVIVR